MLESHPFQEAGALLQALEVALTALLEARVSLKGEAGFARLAAEGVVARLEGVVSPKEAAEFVRLVARLVAQV